MDAQTINDFLKRNPACRMTALNRQGDYLGVYGRYPSDAQPPCPVTPQYFPDDYYVDGLVLVANHTFTDAGIELVNALGFQQIGDVYVRSPSSTGGV